MWNFGQTFGEFLFPISSIRVRTASFLIEHNDFGKYCEVEMVWVTLKLTWYCLQMIDRLQKVQGYQQDVMNIIFRLLNAGCHDVAYQMFSTMRVPQNVEGQTPSVGYFFIRHLVKCGMVRTVVVY